MGLSPGMADVHPMVLGVDVAHGAEMRVVICGAAPSWGGTAQLAFRYEAALSDLERAFAGASRGMPLEHAPFTRSVAFVSGDRYYTDGGDAALDCLMTPSHPGLAARVEALQVERARRLLPR